MYKIYLRNPDGEYPIYEPLDDELRVFTPVLTQQMGSAGSLEFYMMINHPNADKLQLLRTEVVAYNNNQEIFRGRVLRPKYDIQNLISVTCEGDYTYLLDSQQRPFEFEGDIPGLITKLLDIHNSQVDDYKQMLPGRITVAGTEASPHWQNKKFASTKDVLRAQLQDAYGGYFRVRNESGKKYLDYVWDYGGENKQVIRYGVNLLAMDKSLDASNIITCLIPFGADVEYRDEIGEKQTKLVDITSVNGGVDYIQNEDGIKQYGKIWGSYQWNEVTKPEDLLAKAKKYLQEASELPLSLELSVLDLSATDSDEEPLELGHWTQIVSKPHGIDRKMLLTKKVTNLLDPTEGSLVLGKPEDTMVDQTIKGQRAASAAVDKVAQDTSSEINRKTENATNLITGGLGGYVALDSIDPNTGERTHPWRILVMNTPDKETAMNVIQINQNGVGFSTTGINGPYRNAWTIDGNLVADFITVGTMLADRIRGGTLEVGGAGVGKDGIILIKDAMGETVGQFDKNGITILKGNINITAGSITLGKFRVTSDGVMNLDGTSNNSSIGANVVSCGHLNVQGSAEINSGISVSGSSNFNGNLYANKMSCYSIYSEMAGYTWSDKRLKKGIRTLASEDCRRIALGLKGVSYKTKRSKAAALGFVAQDVINLLHDLGLDYPLVGRYDGYLALQYQNMIPILVGALQAQQGEIDALSIKIQSQQQAIDELKKE